MSTLLSNTIKPASGDTVTFADCNVSVGGTLTSEDITSVDSVGLITARSGIEVSGIVTATTYYGDGSNLTGVQAGVVNFVASGTIDNGKTVIIKDDGTVGIVTMVGSSNPDSGTPVVFQHSDTQHTSTVYDSTTDKIVIFYRDNDDSDIGKAVVGTVSGTSIGFGTVTEFSYSSYEIEAASMGGGKVVITYKDSTNAKGQAKVGTISTGNPGSFPNDGRVWSAASHTNFLESTFWQAFDDNATSYAETTGSGQSTIGSMTFDPPIPISSITSFKVNSQTNGNLSQNWGFNGGSLTARVCNGVTDMTDLLPGSGNLTSMEVQITSAGVAAVNEIHIDDIRLVDGANGPSVSFGSSSEFVSGVSGFDYSSATYAGTDTVAIAYRDASNSYHGYVVIGSVDTSANTITFGTPVNIGLFNTEWISTTYDTWNDKLIISYRNQPSNDRGEVIAGDVSGVGVTFGPAAPAQFDGSSGIVFTSTTFDSTNGKIVIAFRDGGSPYPGQAIVGFVTTNNAVSLGSTVEFASATASNENTNVYDSTNNIVCITYQGTDTYGKAVIGTVSGDTISFGSTVELNSVFSSNQSSAYDSTNDKVVIVYRDETSSGNYGNAVVLSPTSSETNLTAENYIGIAAETISDTSTGKINVIGGVNSGQSGLTTAKTYYVGQTGILTTTADTPSVVAGTSISSTKIKVR